MLLVAGGTTLSAKGSDNIKVRSAKDLADWINEIQELNIIADIESVFISSGQGSQINADFWERIVKEVQKAYQRCDGFVLTHDIETVHYTAPALACAMDDIGKPFVITASPYDLMYRSVPDNIRKIFDDYRGFGNKDNLLNALHIAVADLSGVLLVFGNQVHRALEVSPNRIPNLNYFHSISGSTFGKIDFGLKFFPPISGRHNRKFKPSLKFESDIASLEINPSTNADQIKQIALKKPTALILRVAELMAIPKGINVELLKLQKQKIPVLVFQEFQTKQTRSPFIFLSGIPYHTAFVFMLWALGQSKSLPVIRKLLQDKVKQALKKGAA